MQDLVWHGTCGALCLPARTSGKNVWALRVFRATFWPKSEDRRCFVLLAGRKCRLAVTEAILGRPFGIEIVTPREFYRNLGP